MNTTMSDKGTDYVAAWPAGIARQTRLSPAYVAEALVRTGHATVTDKDRLGRAFLRGEPTAEVAALTPTTAKAVVAELRTISAEITATAKTHCHYCGLTLTADGSCHSGCQ